MSIPGTVVLSMHGLSRYTRTRTSVYGTVSDRDADDRVNWAGSQLPPSSDVKKLSREEAASAFNTVKQRDIEPRLAQQPEPRRSVRLSVDDFDDHVVHCRGATDEGDVHLELARALFPQEIAVGNSFELSMGSRSGVKVPIVTPAQANFDAHSELKREFRELIESF